MKIQPYPSDIKLIVRKVQRDMSSINSVLRYHIGRVNSGKRYLWFIVLTCKLISPLLSALAVLPALSGFFAFLSLVTVGATLITLSDLALLPLENLGAGFTPELRLQLYHPCPHHVTLPTRLTTLRPLGPLGHHAVWSCREKGKGKTDKWCAEYWLAHFCLMTGTTGMYNCPWCFWLVDWHRGKDTVVPHCKAGSQSSGWTEHAKYGMLSLGRNMRLNQRVWKKTLGLNLLLESFLGG